MASPTVGTAFGPRGINLEEKLSALRRAIWERRPILGEIICKHGGKVLFDYTQDFLDVNSAPALDERKGELIAVARELIAARLGPEVADGVAAQLAELPLVSTSDHHGSIDHPFFVNANIISGIPLVESDGPKRRYLVVFSFASVSVNNASAFPRGIEFHGGINGSGNFIRLPILPDKLKMGVVYGTRGFTREDLTKAEAELVKKEKAGEMAAGRGDRVRAVLEANFGSPDVLAAPDFCTQISKINFRLWPKFFPTNAHSAANVPDLVYLDIETLVTELLLRHHVTNPNSLLYRLFFDPRFRQLALAHFADISGGFSADQRWGSYLFWAVDDKLHRMRLILNGSTLHTPTSKYVLPLTPEAVAEALRTKKIFPGMLLCYLTVALYYGFKCLGGFCQVHDLTVTKHGWRRLLQAAGNEIEADALEPVQTKELGGTGMVLAYLRTPRGALVPATGIDLATEDAGRTFSDYVALSRRVQMGELMDVMAPEMYRVFYSIDQRDPELLAVNDEAIIHGTGLGRRIDANAVSPTAV